MAKTITNTITTDDWHGYESSPIEVLSFTDNPGCLLVYAYCEGMTVAKINHLSVRLLAHAETLGTPDHVPWLKPLPHKRCRLQLVVRPTA